ncbi:MAG: hypothetical protein E4H01_07200, partial [Lysobacterales bacterium]
MTITSNEMFKVLSLRRARDLGGSDKSADQRNAARQKIINTQMKEQMSLKDKRTKLQVTKELRKSLLQQVKDLDAIREKLAAKYGQHLKDAYNTYKKNVIDKQKVRVEQEKPGALLKKAATFSLGFRPVNAQIERPDPFRPPSIDKDFVTKLADSLTKDQKTLLLKVSGTMQASAAPITSLQEALQSTKPENIESALAGWRTGLIDEANDACRDIHLWENETHLPDTQAAPIAVTDGERPSVRAIGFGELIVAREQLIGYDAREIAHIENVLPGEERLREHTQTTKREVITETEMEEETISKKDLETTDRFELETQSQRVINTEMKLDAGVNTSGKYGLTTVETSLEGSLSRSAEESRSATSKLAHETVSSAVQEIHKSARERRRVTETEVIEEINRHAINGFKFTEGYSGVYYWVEKIHEIELRHYGTRLMLEFFIPEPALSLLPQNAQSTQPFRKPAPLAIGPEDIGEDNYRCLTSLYGAIDVQPPPAADVQVGYAWASSPEESADDHAQSTKQDTVMVPEGYVPIEAWIAVTAYGGGYDPFQLFVSIAGQGQRFYGTTENFGPMPLRHILPAPDGLPIAIRATYNRDNVCTVNIKILCKRTDAWFHRWQLKTFERIREAHAVLVSNYEREVARAQIQGGIEIKGRPAAENRAHEIEELTKWAIKTMRIEPFNFNAVVLQQRREEIDPVLSDAYAPIMRFFQEVFEWRQMSYILYPYYWGRRDSYGYRNNLTDSDPLHQAFLRAGAARVIVPVTPGFEERVLHYLDTQYALGLSESQQIAQH